MTGITVQLLFAGAKNLCNVVRQLANNILQTGFSGRLCVSYACFDQMPGAVKLVTLRQIRPTLLRCFDSEISIEITIRLLHRADHFNDCIRRFFQFSIRRFCQQIPDRLQPFGDIAVLKHHAIELTLALTGGNSEILNRMAARPLPHCRSALSTDKAPPHPSPDADIRARTHRKYSLFAKVLLKIQPEKMTYNLLK